MYIYNSSRSKQRINRCISAILSLLLLFQSTIYPYISILPAPPPTHAQESPPLEASNSASTPAPSPLDLPLNLDTIFPSTQSAETPRPEPIPEATPSARPEPIPEATASPSATPGSIPIPAQHNPPLLSPTPVENPTSTPTPPASTPTPSPDSFPKNSLVEVDSAPVLDPFAIDLIYPFTGRYPVSYAFGEHSPSDYINRMQSLFNVTGHDGIDFAMDIGTPILATSQGIIKSAGLGIYGITIQIQHAWGISYYGHLSELVVQAGDLVKIGQIIGYSGNSGVTTGPHLHFAIAPNNPNFANGYHGLINPLPYFSKLGTLQVLGASTTRSKAAYPKRLARKTKYQLAKRNLSLTSPDLTINFTEPPTSELNIYLKDPHGIESDVTADLTGDLFGPVADHLTFNLAQKLSLSPGAYELTIVSPDGTYQTENFTWGVLAINTNRASYLPGFPVDFSIAVLDNQGDMVCDADLNLTITSPSGAVTKLTTQNGEVVVNMMTCLSKNFTLTPDYFARYHPTEPGIYTVELSSMTDGIARSISSSFSVKSDNPFDVERLTITRVYPILDYPVMLRVHAFENYHGKVQDTLPANFELVEPKTGEQPSYTTFIRGDRRVIEWDVDWQKDHDYTLTYQFNSPDKSPDFYTLGPLQIGTRFTETKSWQLAIDASTTIILNYAHTILTSGTTWTVPLDWTDGDNTIEVIGGGGAGFTDTTGATGAGGGGGGAYAKSVNLDLTPGTTLTYQIGQGGIPTSVNGGDTFFNRTSGSAGTCADTTSACAKGGTGATSATGASGGLASSSYATGTGNTKNNGGTGGTGNTTSDSGGGGGGAGGPNGAGGGGGAGDTDNATDGVGGGGGGNGGGAAGGSGITSDTVGANGGNGNGGTGGGTGGSAADGGNGTAGTGGGGGGGADNFDGGNGANGTDFASGTVGSGGGGGGTGDTATTTGMGGNGGLYGGGGGGGRYGGYGAPGIIVITYNGGTPTNTSWKVPGDWNSSDNSIIAIGGGGAGVSAAQGTGEAGGGGGGYSKITNLSLTPGNSVTYQVGAGGRKTTVGAGAGTAGTASFFNRTAGTAGTCSDTVSVCANPGSAGSGTTGGGGGSTTGADGTTLFAGGAGGAGNSTGDTGGGGGGAGGTAVGQVGGAGSSSTSGGGGGGGGAGGTSSSVGQAGQTTTGGTGGNGPSGTGSGSAGNAGHGGAGGSATGGGGGGGDDVFGGGAGGSGSSTTYGGGGGGGAGDNNTAATSAAYGGFGGLFGGGGGGGLTNGFGAEGIIIITYTPVEISIAGTANGNNGATVKVAVNGNIQSQTTTISSGTWTITNVPKPLVDDIVTVWIDGVADSNESTAATKYSSGNISGMVLDTNVISIGSNQNTSLSLTNLNSYDCSEDEDIMYQAASSHLKVEGDSCAGSTTNSYSTELLSILSSNTLTVATSETITTYDLTLSGTLTSSGNSTYNVSHNWTNSSGTFTQDTSTVNLTGADSTTQTLSGSTTFYNLSASTTSNSAGRTIRYTAGTTTTVTGTWTMNGASGKLLTLESSTTSAWTITPTLASVTYVVVSYSTGAGTSFCANNSTNNGNNTSWYISSGSTCQITENSFERKTWYDGTRYWRSSFDITNQRIVFEYSATGSSWTENTSARITTTTSDYSIEADSSNIFVTYSTANDIKGRIGSSYPGTGFTWGSEQVVFNGSSSTDDYSYPTLARDSSNYVWVAARFSGSGVYYVKTIKETSAANDLPEDSGDTVYSLANIGNTNTNVMATLVSLGSQNMYANFVENASLQGCKWVNASSAWQNTAGNSCSGATSNAPTQVSDASDDTTSSATYTLLSGMTITPGAGDYLVHFNTTIKSTDVNGSTQNVSLFVGGSQVTHTERQVYTEESFDAGDIDSLPVGIDAYLPSVTAGQAIEVRWKTDLGTATSHERTLIVQPISSSDLSQATATANTTTTSTTDVQLDSMTLTPGAGDYLIYFTGSMGSNTTSDIIASIYVNGSQIAASSRDIYIESSFATTDTFWGIMTQAYVAGVGAGQTIDVRWHTTAGTATSLERTLVVQKVSSANVSQATATATATTTSTSYTQLNSMTLTPGAGDYLAFFSTSILGPLATSSTNHYVSLYAAGSQLSHTERQIYIENSLDAGSSFPVSTTAYIPSLGVSDAVEIKWKTDSDTATAHERVLTLLKITNSGGYTDSIATGLTGRTNNFSSVVDGSGNIHLTYIDSSGHTLYAERTSSWQTPITLDSNAGNSYSTISYNTSSGDLYAFWIRGDDIFYKKGASPYGSGNWDVSATSWQASGTNTYVSSNYSGSNKIFAEWYDGTTISWAALSLGGGNSSPDSPTSLAQKTTGDVAITTGNWHNSTSVKFTASATDPDGSDTLYLCVEADLLGVSFSNTEDSCGSGVAYSGAGITVTHTLTLTDASEYHWQVRTKDTAGAYSSWVSYGGNAESARDVGIDSTAPTGGTVYDGTGAGVDITFATNSLSSLSANWSGISSNVSGLLRYDYSIGTSAGATDIKAWTSNSTATSITATGLTLQTSQMYYFNVRAVDNAGNTQTAISSNGQLVSPSISFAITPATTTFNNLSPSNSYTDTEVTTLTTSTNAYNGYVIRAYVTDYLRSTTGGTTIGDFSGGTYASPATWVGSETGFGYTSSDTTIGGTNKFATGTLFAPFSQTGPGDIVADHTTTVTGSAISNEAFDITYKVKVPSTQAAKSYNTAVVYTATAQY